MPRRLLTRLVPTHHGHPVLQRWPLNVFGERLADPKLWTLHRRGVCGGIGAGLSICFLPLPVHTVLAVLVSLTWRLNIPATIAATLVVNPLTMVPLFYGAYRIGALALGLPVSHFGFQLSFDWLQHGLGPLWKPFLLGCLLCSATAGIGGWLLSSCLWRQRVQRRRQRGRA